MGPKLAPNVGPKMAPSVGPRMARNVGRKVVPEVGRVLVHDGPVPVPGKTRGRQSPKATVSTCNAQTRGAASCRVGAVRGLGVVTFKPDGPLALRRAAFSSVARLRSRASAMAVVAWVCCPMFRDVPARRLDAKRVPDLGPKWAPKSINKKMSTGVSLFSRFARTKGCKGKGSILHRRNNKHKFRPAS